MSTIGSKFRERVGLRLVMGLFYAVAGVSHLLKPRVFERIVPPSFPQPRVLVYISGIAEIVLGVGVLFERTRRLSAWGIIGLLVAVFPANVYMATDDVAAELVPASAADKARLAAWARLPLQAVLVAWAWLYTKPPADET